MIKDRQYTADLPLFDGTYGLAFASSLPLWWPASDRIVVEMAHDEMAVHFLGHQAAAH